MTSNELRAAFLRFFEERGHAVVPSSSLVPGSDPTLLFTNSGMVQFKDVFLGRESRPYVRACSSQRSLRAGGKHNDLENVGYTARHHTFFEMLGNFSFGDYFKREAIRHAWSFLTGVVQLPPERLWVTVYQDDDEAADIWLNEIGVDPGRFSRLGEASNFWQMGDTGPCGPCSEIFFDHGPGVAGGPPGSPDEDGDRYIEIWNLVFMQFNRDKEGVLTRLPKPSVDTGMGLERLAAVMQGVHDNYDTDLFTSLIAAAAEVTGACDRGSRSLRVVADHIRSCSFLICDGVLPGNEGRGYVLRRIIRRAIRHGHLLGAREPFFHRLVAPLAAQMGGAYPELVNQRELLERVLLREEEQFAETLDKGLKILEDDLKRLQGSVIPGDTVFRLYDTYGFPVDLTGDIARERGLTLDLDGFEHAMTAQRDRARAAGKFDSGYNAVAHLEGQSCFTGYELLEDQGTIMALYCDGEPVDVLHEGETGLVILDRTPFYAESGGQAGDAGELFTPLAQFDVEDTQKQGAHHGHLGRQVKGLLRRGDRLRARVDPVRRRATALNHSATHLMHKALRDVLGAHVQQKGSLVDASRTRFDFAHFEPMTAEQVAEVERRVNAQIQYNADTRTRVMGMEAARAEGAMALFGEKYGDEVRVLNIGDSIELCGGTHVARTGDIGLFKIVSEGGVAAGVRRVEAVTGGNALDWLNDNTARLDRMAGLLKAARGDAEDKLKSLLERLRGLEKDLEKIKAQQASAAGASLADAAVDIGGIKLLAARLDGADVKTLRDTVDQLKNKLGAAAVLLASVSDGKVNIIAGVSKQETTRLKAGDLANFVAQRVGGKGGGRPDMAQAGGTQPEHLDAALAAVPDWARGQL
jgi:alanyl-tRNA synthetase